MVALFGVQFLDAVIKKLFRLRILVVELSADKDEPGFFKGRCIS